MSKVSKHRSDTNALSYKQKFDYDRFGNLYRKQANNTNSLSAAWIEDSAISKSTNRFTLNTQYDDAGNVIQDTKFRNFNSSYDANGRMFKTSNIQNTNQANSVYDAGGQRVATQVDNVWTFFIYDIGGKMVAEYGGVPAIDEGGIKYVLQDWQGSSRAVLSNTGVVQARMDYTAFGEEIQSGVGQRTTSQGFNANNNLNQKYAQTERDKASGLDHTWFRKNENKAGRWTSPDPYNGSMSLGNPQSFNRYSYVGNEPTNFIDPSGLNAIAFFYPTNCRVVGEARDGSAIYSCDWNVHYMNIGGGSTGGTEPGGGGGPESEPRRDSTDPCAGKKGKLDHSSALQHITDRHIEQTKDYVNKKSYYTFGILTSTTIGKQTAVINTNQEAFEKGGAIKLSGGGIAYIYAPYSSKEIMTPLGPAKFETGAIGKDEHNKFKVTNVRTVIVSSKDCKTVETSYPGLPKNIDKNDPRIVGSPHWWNAFNSRL